MPQLSRLAVIGVPDLNAVQFVSTEAATKAARIETEILEVRSPDDFEGAMDTARAKHANAGILLSSPLVYGQLKKVAELALVKLVPSYLLVPKLFQIWRPHVLWTEHGG